MHQSKTVSERETPSFPDYHLPSKRNLNPPFQHHEPHIPAQTLRNTSEPTVCFLANPAPTLLKAETLSLLLKFPFPHFQFQVKLQRGRFAHSHFKSSPAIH